MVSGWKLIAVIDGKDYSVLIWDVQNGTLLSRMSAHTDIIRSMAWSPDGTRLVTGSLDKTAIVWSAKGEILRTLLGHTNGITVVIWDLSYGIITGSYDKTMRVWSNSSYELRTVFNLDIPVLSLDTSPDRKQFAVGLDDGIIKIYGTDQSEIIQVDGEYVTKLSWESNTLSFSSGKTVTLLTPKAIQLTNLQNQIAALISQLQPYDSASTRVRLETLSLFELILVASQNNASYCIPCQSNQYFQNGQCVACPESCLKCNKIGCMQCLTDHYLINGGCTKMTGAVTTIFKQKNEDLSKHFAGFLSNSIKMKKFDPVNSEKILYDFFPLER